jgi:hypothetical protein
MNLNQLAKLVTLAEGKKKSLSVAQVKEVLRCLADVLHNNGAEAFLCLDKYLTRRVNKLDSVKHKKLRKKAK